MRRILMPPPVERKNTLAWLGAALLVPPLAFWVALAFYLTGWPWGGELLFRTVPEPLLVALLLAAPVIAAVIGFVSRRASASPRARSLGAVALGGGLLLTLVWIAAGIRPS